MNKKINNILKYGSYLLVFLLPIFYLGNMYFPFVSPKTYLFSGCVEILTALSIYALIFDPSYRLSKKTLLYFLPLVCFLFWLTISGILAPSPNLAFWSTFDRGTGLLSLYHCLAFALIISSLVKRNGTDYLYKLIGWFINGGFILALSLWFGDQGFNAFKFLQTANGGGLMGNSSLAAVYLMFVLAFVFFLFFSKQFKGSKWWLGIKIAVILFSPIFVNILGLFNGRGLLGSARGATLGLLVGLVSAFVWYLFISKNKTLRFLGIVGIVVGLLVFSVGWMQLINPNTKLHHKFVAAATGTRFIFDGSSQNAMNKHPWFGYGPENYMIAFQENFNPKMVLAEYNHEGWADHSHNIYYDTGVSGGYPAIALYTLFILSLLYVLYKLSKLEIFNHIQISILAGLIIGYVFQNLFVFDSLLSLVALFTLAGIIFASENILIKEKFLQKSISLIIKNSIIIILVIACCISLIFFTFRPIQKSLAYDSIVHMPINVRVNHYNDLLKGSPVGDMWDYGGMAYGLYKLYNVDPVKIKNDKKLLPYVEDDIKSLLWYAQIIQTKNKFDIRLDIGIVSLYNILNYFNDNTYNPILGDYLITLLNQAETIAPENLQIYWNIAQVYIWKGDYKAVEDTYIKAIAIDPTIPVSHELLIGFAKSTGNQKLYDDSLIQAQKDIPGFVID